METKLLGISHEDLLEAADLLKRGGLVAIPTETVYGLAGNGLDPVAVAKIFQAKGRPQDNPLILHISEPAQMELLCRDIPKAAWELAGAFWPGPLTLVLRCRDIVPAVTTAGLSTVAVRCPENPAARALIEMAGVPLAAPSANISGRPSPTRARHVIEDMSGKIDAIVDGGDCSVGLESTIIDLSGGTPRLLRPGGLPLEMIEKVTGRVEVPSALMCGEEPEIPMAPGMKYRHYAPKARVILVSGEPGRVAAYINSQGENSAVLCISEEVGQYSLPCIIYGSVKEPDTMARGLFAALRELDEKGFETAYACCPSGEGILLAVQNRLKKAAAEIINAP